MHQFYRITFFLTASTHHHGSTSHFFAPPVTTCCYPGCYLYNIKRCYKSSRSLFPYLFIHSFIKVCCVCTLVCIRFYPQGISRRRCVTNPQATKRRVSNPERRQNEEFPIPKKELKQPLFRLPPSSKQHLAPAALCDATIPSIIDVIICRTKFREEPLDADSMVAQADLNRMEFGKSIIVLLIT
jgi:hypothetical protein